MKNLLRLGREVVDVVVYAVRHPRNQKIAAHAVSWLAVALLAADLAYSTSKAYQHQKDIEKLEALNDLNAGLNAKNYFDIRVLEDTLDDCSADLLIVEQTMATRADLNSISSALLERTSILESRVQKIRDMLDAFAKTVEKSDSVTVDTLESLSKSISALSMQIAADRDFLAQMKVPQSPAVFLLQGTVGEEGPFQQIFQGNGVVIAPGVLLTAAHVWDTGCKLFVIIGDKQWELKDRKTHPVADITIYNFDPAAYSGPYPELADAMPERGDTIWITGWLSGLMDKTAVSRGVYMGPRGPKDIHVDMAATRSEMGLSGSPVWFKGKVIGITVLLWTRNPPSGDWTGFVPISVIRELLKP